MVLKFENLDSFRILRIIGSGSYGTVFESIDTSTGCSVALKFCFLEEGKISLDLKREMLILSLLDSPFFPKFYGYVQKDSFLVIALELCEGISLKNFIDKQYQVQVDDENSKYNDKVYIFDENLTLIILKQILDAVYYLHSCNIVHRDIKLENIIISSEKMIKICDFGFARFFESNIPFTEFSGSQQYISPEVLFNKPHDGPQNDIWTIGICLLKMCIGEDEFYRITNGKSILSLYSIFEDKIGSYRLRILLKLILQSNPNNRLSLAGIYNYLKLQIPEINSFKFVFLDIVTVHQMQKLDIITESIFSQGKEAHCSDDFKIYKLLFKKIYGSRETNFHSLDKTDLTEIYRKSIKSKNLFFCCHSAEYLTFEFRYFYKFEDLMTSSNIPYLIAKRDSRKVQIQFPQYSLVMDYLIQKRMEEHYLIKFVKISGSIDDFTQTVQDIMTNFCKTFC